MVLRRVSLKIIHQENVGNSVILSLTGIDLISPIDFVNFKIGVGLIILILDTFLLTVWQYYDGSTARAYCNPLVILSAIVIFLIFLNLQVKENKLIVHLAKGAFTVFLLHQIFLPYAKIEQFVSGSVILLLAHIGITCIVVYFVCYIIYIVYDFVMTPIFAVLKRFIGKRVFDVEMR